MTTRDSAPDKQPDRQSGDRQRGEVTFRSVDAMLDEHLGADIGPEPFGRLQLEMLLPVYLELRHGHDQQAAHTRAITKQTEVLGALANEIKGPSAPAG